MPSLRLGEWTCTRPGAQPFLCYVISFRFSSEGVGRVHVRRASCEVGIASLSSYHSPCSRRCLFIEQEDRGPEQSAMLGSYWLGPKLDEL